MIIINILISIKNLAMVTSLGQGWVRTSRGKVARHISAVETPARDHEFMMMMKMKMTMTTNDDHDL